jgi:hypothetical protein
MISMMILCVEAMKALCCLVIFCWRVHWSKLIGYLHIVPVTMPSHICCYGVVGFDFEPPWVTAYRFTKVWARLCYWFLRSWLRWLLCQDAFFRVGCYFAIFWLCFISTLFGLIGKTMRIFGDVHELKDLF